MFFIIENPAYYMKSFLFHITPGYLAWEICLSRLYTRENDVGFK
jgi:hypothetical protein